MSAADPLPSAALHIRHWLARHVHDDGIEVTLVVSAPPHPDHPDEPWPPTDLPPLLLVPCPLERCEIRTPLVPVASDPSNEPGAPS